MDYSDEIVRLEAEIERLKPIADFEAVLQRHGRDVGALLGTRNELAVVERKLAEIKQADYDEQVLNAYQRYEVLAADVAFGRDSAREAEHEAVVQANPHFAYVKAILQRQIPRQAPYFGDPLSGPMNFPGGVMPGTTP